jgi:hypothetical protein
LLFICKNEFAQSGTFANAPKQEQKTQTVSVYKYDSIKEYNARISYMTAQPATKEKENGEDQKKKQSPAPKK